MRWVVAVAVVVCLGSVAHAQGAAPPATVVYVIDRAMPVEKLEVVTRSLAEAIGQLDASDRVAVIGAGPVATIDVALQLATPAAKKKIASSISRMAWSERSNLTTAVVKASTIIMSSRGPNRHVVLVTDDARIGDLEKPVRALRDKSVEVSTVAYQIGTAKLDYLGSIGGGGHVVAPTPAELVDHFVELSGSGTVGESLAVVLVIDRSGSMSGPKLEAAKEAARTVAETLAPDDLLGVIAFDSESQVHVDAQRAANRAKIAAAISRIQAGGGTNIYPGLLDAFRVLQGLDSTRKMVVLLSDGGAPWDGIAALVQDMRSARITVSAVGLQGADRNLLSMIAEAGAGRLYMVEDIGSLPRIFMKETQPKRRP
ncbi:MAG: VWA domain-containing protein [Myxococcales bacterium]|nr:VWA domain-containing protein [Myxococcales bacterium]